MRCWRRSCSRWTQPGSAALCLRGWPGPARDRICAWVRELLPDGAPLLRVPLHITDDRLLGGLSTWRRRFGRAGVVARARTAGAGGRRRAAGCHGRAPRAHTSPRTCARPSTGANCCSSARAWRARFPARVGVVALDEGLDEERAPASLRDRLAFDVDLQWLSLRATDVEPPDEVPRPESAGAAAAGGIRRGSADRPVHGRLALGIDSLRAPRLALAAARAHAALQGRVRVEEEDAAAAARLVLGPRATRMPAESETKTRSHSRGTPRRRRRTRPPTEGPQDSETPSDTAADARPLEDVVLEAAKSGLPAGLLDALASGQPGHAATRRAGQSGALRASNAGGRPAGVLAKPPRSGERLNVVATLRAAAPWQPLRRRERAGDGPAARAGGWRFAKTTSG